MASLGFNILAIQEDLVSSLLLLNVKLHISKFREVLEMLTMFDVLSVQVVFALLDMSQSSFDQQMNKILNDTTSDLISPIKLINGIDRTQLKEFCLE